MGLMQWLDTGYELPEIIARHGLRHEALSYRAIADQDAFTTVQPFARLDVIRQPEFFYLGGKPFLCHFKKGSMKAMDGTTVSLFDLFVANVEGFLATRALKHDDIAGHLKALRLAGVPYSDEMIANARADLLANVFEHDVALVLEGLGRH